MSLLHTTATMFVPKVNVVQKLNYNNWNMMNSWVSRNSEKHSELGCAKDASTFSHDYVSLVVLN